MTAGDPTRFSGSRLRETKPMDVVLNDCPFSVSEVKSLGRRVFRRPQEGPGHLTPPPQRNIL